MKTTIETKSVGAIAFNAVFKGDKRAEWSSDSHPNYNNYRITVTIKGKRMTFYFWGSIMNPEIMNPEISTQQDALTALDCFLSDAQYGDMTFSMFCDELGYNTDSRKAEQTHKACVKAWSKVYRALGNEDLFYDLLQEIQGIEQDK